MKRNAITVANTFFLKNEKKKRENSKHWKFQIRWNLYFANISFLFHQTWIKNDEEKYVKNIYMNSYFF